jgi:nicotinamide-nucleotide amidase
MTAVVLAVGSELLRPGRRDTNGDWLVERLLDLGIETRWRSAVDDDVERIARLIRAAWEGAGLVVLTGGLGPTEDDRTREALALALDAPLTRDPAMTRWITSMFSSRGRVAGPRQWRQADRPEGAAWIENALGSAPGLLVERDGRVLAALPGVPAEMKAMFDATVAPRLAASAGGALARTTLRIAGRPESWVDDIMRDLYGTGGTTTTILASAGSVELLVTARGTDAADARARLAALASAGRPRPLRAAWLPPGRAARSPRTGRRFGQRGSRCSPNPVPGASRGRLHEVPGSSGWFRGVVCYADDLKSSLLGVPGRCFVSTAR